MDKCVNSNLCILNTSTILETIKLINQNEDQLALVVDNNRQLLGVVTDGDIRRGIIKGVPLNSCVTSVMKTSPTVALESDSKAKMLMLLREARVKFLPVIDNDNVVIDVVKLNDLLMPIHYENTVVIMAGGKGVRLGSLTENCPKPMLKIGNKPIIETIINNFHRSGFLNFVISVNYLKEQIIDYLGDGTNFGVNISYLEEDFPLGTAGALSNLKLKEKLPFIVVNGDIYTDLDFADLLDQHNRSEASATMCLRNYNVQIPYGVVHINDNEIIAISEKPIIQNTISAGIYVFSPSVINYIPRDTFYPMTDLFKSLIAQKANVHSYQVDGIWIDIGQQTDFERAKSLCVE